MGDKDKAEIFAWILSNHDDDALDVTYQKFQEILGRDFASEEVDIEAAVAKRLQRQLSDEERFRLRPIAMEIYANYYGEE